jgi:hypothetical protein
MTSLGMHTPVNETDGMPLEMPKSISNLLDDDDDEPGHQFVVQSDHRSPVQVHVGKADMAAGGRQVDIVLEKQGAQPDLGKIMLVAEHTKLFPPPPPPLDAEAPDPVTGLARDSMHKRMMRWYQVTELWCKAEEAVPDKERVIVAPPPRPPPFADTHGVVFPVPTAPVAYSFDRWMAQCRRWWGHVAHHYDNLRSGERFEPAKHVSTGPVELTDRRILLQLCVVDL